MDMNLLLPIAISPIIGSFLGVLVRRLPTGRPIILARSSCETCGHRLRPYDLIPIASFMALAGRCRYCDAEIDRDHLNLEMAAVAVALWAWYAFDPGFADPVRLWFDCVLGWGLLALAVIDWRHYILPDAVTLPLVLLGLVDGWMAGTGSDQAAGAVAGFVLLAGIAWVYKRLRGRDGLGDGDSRLLAAGGAWVGLAALPQVIVLAAVGGIVGGAMMLGGSDQKMMTTRIPFGPFLAAGIWIVRLYGPFWLG